MALWLGTRRREKTKDADKAGYVVEVEPVWEHYCKPPVSNTGWEHVIGRSPILSDGSTAEVGTKWRCPECGAISEVWCPNERKPGWREWRLEERAGLTRADRAPQDHDGATESREA